MDLASELQGIRDEDAMAACRRLFDHFGGKARSTISLQQQAELLEHILRRCIPHSDGSASLTICMTLDAPQLADLAVSAYRLRKMVPHEASIREMVIGRSA